MTSVETTAVDGPVDRSGSGTPASERLAALLGTTVESVPVGDTTFRHVAVGPTDGPLALCLHGFPDSPVTWRHLLPRLADAGYRAVAPWMRGYAPTDAPVRGRTHPRRLAADVNGLHTALGGDDRAVLVGHDWGAFAANEAASRASRRSSTGGRTPWRRVITMAIPPATSLPNTPWDDPRQVWMSRYVYALSAPGGRRLLRRRDFQMVDRLWRRWSPSYAPGDLDRDGWREALLPDQGVTAIGYYRAMLPSLLLRRWPLADEGCSSVPTLHLAGSEDGCMHAGQAAGAERELPAGSVVEVMDGVGHFLHLERPDDVADRILDFVGVAAD